MLARRCGLGVAALALLLAAAEPEPKEDKLKALLKERLATVRLIAERTEAGYKAGTLPVEKLMEAADAVLKAELDLCETPKERVAALEKLVEAAKRREALVERMVKAASAPSTALLKAKAGRLEAEIALERAKPKK